VIAPDGIMAIDDCVLRLSEREVWIDDAPLRRGFSFVFGCHKFDGLG
jgi:hypothetical protein